MGLLRQIALLRIHVLEAVDSSCLGRFVGPRLDYVSRELRSYGYSYSFLNAALRSYQEFPNHMLDSVESLGLISYFF